MIAEIKKKGTFDTNSDLYSYYIRAKTIYFANYSPEHFIENMF